MTGDKWLQTEPKHWSWCVTVHLTLSSTFLGTFKLYKANTSGFPLQVHLNLVCLSLMPKRYLLHQQQLQQNVVF